MSDVTVGGQAVIEGVMMRSIGRIATACRIADGSIVIQGERYTSLTRRYSPLSWPILRGIVSFFEMTIIGIRTLNFSTDIAMKDAEKSDPKRRDGAMSESSDVKDENSAKRGGNTLPLIFSTVIALGVGIAVFFFAPLAICSAMGIQKSALTFNLVAGAIRISFFILYIWGLSLLKDFQRVFEYHGAEHKTITAWENKSPLIPSAVINFTRFHPRCGTSFILIVALFAVMTFALSDTLYSIFTGFPPTLLKRFALHFSLLPLVAGVSYELLRFSAKTQEHPLTRALIQPGLWLQRITTREPNLEQLAVAIVALEDALEIRTPVSGVATIATSPEAFPSRVS